MAQHPVDEWFALKIQQSARLARFGAIALIPLSILAATCTWILFALLVLPAVLILYGFHLLLIAVIASFFLALTFVWQFKMGSAYEDEFEFGGRTFRGMEWAMIRAAGSGWAVFIFDPHLGSAFTRFLSAILITSPRMIQLSKELKRRQLRLEAANVDACGKIVKRMVKTQKRVKLDDIEKNMPGEDHATLLQTLTDVDGIIFLTKNGTGLTLAPRLNVEFQEWLAERGDDEDFDENDEPEDTGAADEPKDS